VSVLLSHIQGPQLFLQWLNGFVGGGRKGPKIKLTIKRHSLSLLGCTVWSLLEWPGISSRNSTCDNHLSAVIKQRTDCGLDDQDSRSLVS